MKPYLQSWKFFFHGFFFITFLRVDKRYFELSFTFGRGDRNFCREYLLRGLRDFTNARTFHNNFSKWPITWHWLTYFPKNLLVLKQNIFGSIGKIDEFEFTRVLKCFLRAGSLELASNPFFNRKRGLLAIFLFLCFNKSWLNSKFSFVFCKVF